MRRGELTILLVWFSRLDRVAVRIFPMNAGLIKSSSAVLVAGLLLTGCENMSPEANGALFGAGAGALAGGLASAAGASSSEAVAIGLATGQSPGLRLTSSPNTRQPNVNADMLKKGRDSPIKTHLRRAGLDTKRRATSRSLLCVNPIRRALSR